MGALNSYVLKDFQGSDWEAVLELNQSETPGLGDLNRESLMALADAASYFKLFMQSNKLAGFLVGFVETDFYQSLNFLWFKERYPKFFYIDRIAISPRHRRQGLGRKLYEDCIEFASSQERPLTCEVNIIPRNQLSLDFHHALGFQEAGQQDTEGGKKRVSLLIREFSRV